MNKFGFPLVYTELSEFYDALNSDDTDQKNHIIKTLLLAYLMPLDILLNLTLKKP